MKVLPLVISTPRLARPPPLEPAELLVNVLPLTPAVPTLARPPPSVVSERGVNPAEDDDLASGIAFAAYDELVDRRVELLGDDRSRQELGQRGYRVFSARSQVAILGEVLSSGLDR